MHGYSSSEESDDPRRPRAQPATTNNNDQKKKKKKKLPPQKSINRIWKKFSKRKFHKALAVLPFDPVQPPATYHSNELLSAGYERAAEECRRKVEKIIKECKRVNMRYRDPGWDLDWDLKYEKGHCLNNLGSQKFELNRTTLLSSKAAVPKAVKRVHEIFENVTKLRQKKDQKKASASRQKERRRMWEKRSTNRDVTKQQTKKNADKRKRRRAEWEAEQSRLDEEFNAKVKAEREQMKKERLAKAEAEKAAEAEKRAQEADDEGLSKKTEEIKISEDKDEPVVVDEHHKDHDDAVISVSTGSPHLTPKSMDSTAEGAEEKQEVPPVSGGPPAPIEEEEPLPIRPRPAYDSAGESSDSPVEDWEALYSSDDMVRKPRLTQANQTAAQDDYDSEEEKMPEPWNAICIVGVRVYSKDENLELRTVMEGGELLEGGMGPKGAADLDNAQSNAGGGRADDKDASKTKQDDDRSYPPVIRKDGKYVEDETTSGEKYSSIQSYFHIDSAFTTRVNSPAPTPYEHDRRLEFPAASR
ncbi:hypothetical protein FOC1_g10009361 [Fusarium oxysporum f. sp. cubense race 1]|uniref:Uncharacterized protein n=1 Tax=Fusarium oxysporum f. sp. cubense (strain race 1) TaxID=1229664 RepID=N4U1X6_FUSC1|nr:hypothetical protein FOC1_g10009361 [Fusarium oxysporum f. sp. cubense race 1]